MNYHLYFFVRAAIIKFHSSGSWKSKIKVSAVLVSPEDPLSGLQMACPLCSCTPGVCVQIGHQSNWITGHPKVLILMRSPL